jgi:prevent-host-death family protein
MRTELVTTLKRQATELLADIERNKEPILITQHGLPSAYLVDVETYELLQQRMALLAAFQPSQAPLHALLGKFPGGTTGHHMVELHDHVGAEVALDAHD